MPARKRGKQAAKHELSAPAEERFPAEADALAADLLRGDCVVFAGAGVSAEALPKWSELVEMLGLALPELRAAGSSPSDFLDIAQWYVEEHGRERLLREIVRVYDSPKVRPTALASALAALPASVYFTTNYDRTLELALRERFSVPDVVVDDRHIALIDERNRTTVVKMHGSVTRPESVVLTREDYATYGESHRAMITYLQSQLATRTFLFVGFSFADPNFRVIYEAIQRALGRYRRQPYALIIDPNNPLMLRHWERRGVRMLAFPQEGGGEAVLAFVRSLQERVTERRRAVSLSVVLHRLGSPHPPPAFPHATEVGRQLEQAAACLQEMVRQATPHDSLDASAGSPPAPARPSDESKVESLYRLVGGFEGLGLYLDPADWVRLGNELYLLGDLESAVTAYSTAIRRRVEEGGQVPQGDGVDPRVLGNLARAYIGLRQYSRAEDLLRELALEKGEKGPRLAVNWLRQRPGDLGELARLANLQAQLALTDGHFDQAARRLDEARPLLEDGLDRDLFEAERPKHGISLTDTRAYALSTLGHNHRLRFAAAMGVHDLEAARHHHARAVAVLEQARQANPYLPEPWVDLLALYEQDVLAEKGVAARAAKLRRELQKLGKDEEGERVRRAVDAGLAHAVTSADEEGDEDGKPGAPRSDSQPAAP